MNFSKGASPRERRMVFQSTPMRRAMSCWLAPRASSVSMVIRKCRLQVVQLLSYLGKKRASVNFPPLRGAGYRPSQVSRRFSSGHSWGNSLGGRRPGTDQPRPFIVQVVHAATTTSSSWASASPSTAETVSPSVSASSNKQV